MFSKIQMSGSRILTLMDKIVRYSNSFRSPKIPEGPVFGSLFSDSTNCKDLQLTQAVVSH